MKLQKSKAWGMAAMSPGSMAASRSRGSEERDSTQATRASQEIIHTWLSKVLANPKLLSFPDIPICSDYPGLCCWISDVLDLQGKPAASFKRGTFQMHLGIRLEFLSFLRLGIPC